MGGHIAGLVARHGVSSACCSNADTCVEPHCLPNGARLGTQPGWGLMHALARSTTLLPPPVPLHTPPSPSYPFWCAPTGTSPLALWGSYPTKSCEDYILGTIAPGPRILDWLVLEQLGLEFRAKGDTSESCFKTTFVSSIVIYNL